MEPSSKNPNYTYPEDVFELERNTYNDGELLVNPYANRQADIPKILSKYSFMTNRHSKLGDGCEGEVRAVGDKYAVKRFYDRTYKTPGGETVMLANIAVAEALKTQTEPLEGYNIRGVEIYGAVHADSKHLWVMERLRAATSTKLDEFSLNIPHCLARTRLVDTALKRIGVTPYTVFRDDGPQTSNHIVTRKATAHEPGEIVLIDTRPAPL